MTKHKWKLLGTAAFILILLLLALRQPSHTSIESNADLALKANYARIRDGMTYAQVVAVLGPPGDQAPEAGEFESGWQVMSDDPYCVWYTDTVGVVVHFDRGFRVVDKNIDGVQRADPAWTQRFLKQLREWCQRWLS